MVKGGYRENNKVESNHLFKPKWNNKKTIAIRVPEVLKNVLLKIAKHLDKTDFSANSDDTILNDIINCFLYKEKSIKYKNRVIELRQEKRELIHQNNRLSSQNKQKKSQNKYQLAVECFEEFIKSQNLNVEELSKSRKGTKKHQLFEINQWLIKKSNNTN